MTTTLSSAKSRAGSRSGVVRGPLAAGAEVRLVLPAYRPGERPKGEALPSLAVLGRSNVGKSTLLNALLGTKVARVSQTPGRTQALFWYRVGEKFDVVDCPGYGFSKTGKEKRKSFEGLIESLLLGSSEDADAVSTGAQASGATAALLLVDGRLDPQSSDLSMSLFLRESSVLTVVAATKWDAVKPSERVRRRRALSAAYETPDRPLLPVS
ncbi:MAG TPA: GTP-binding protein 8, partial [Thermoanaerobaculia bacterium]